MASKYPERVHYQTLIIREARRCGAKGWLSYDSYFRQQMAGEWKGDEWGRLNPYLFSSTFLALGSTHWPNCTLCHGPDQDECALAKAKPSSTQSVSKPCDHPRGSPPRPAKEKIPRFMVCFQWNQGECSFTFFVSSDMPVCGVEVTTRSCIVGPAGGDRCPLREKEEKGGGDPSPRGP